VCDEICAKTFTHFWADCKDFINTEVRIKSVRMLFEGVNGLCRKTLHDNEVHDTDPVTPGEQFDPNRKLAASVHCHQDVLDTAGKLSTSTGPMDGLWMLGVNGDSACLYSEAVKTRDGKTGRSVVDPSKQRKCQIMKNKQLLFDTMEKRFGDCTLSCKGEGCSRGPDSGWVEPNVGDGTRRRKLSEGVDTSLCEDSPLPSAWRTAFPQWATCADAKNQFSCGFSHVDLGPAASGVPGLSATLSSFCPVTCNICSEGLPNYEICDYSLDTNGDGKVGAGDDLWHSGMFGCILSKDALYYLVTNNVTAPLVKFAECDEAIGGR